MNRLIFAAAIFVLCAGTPNMTADPEITARLPQATCDDTLWQHIYHGTFPTAQDRLQVIDPCKTVTGTLHFVRNEADGDAHLRLDVDPEFKSLLNDASQNEDNMLVVEVMCVKSPKQKDTKHEGVCSHHWKQTLYNKKLNNQRVQVTGAYIVDQEDLHGWTEIHPVT